MGANDSGTYAGLDNVASSTRFIFSGEARVSPNVKAGFEIMTEWNLGGRTSTVDQSSPDGGTTPAFAASDGGLGVRRAFWWLEDKNLGRISVGRHNAGGPVGTIDLGGVSVVASAAPSDIGGSFFVAPGGTTRLSAVMAPSYGNDRVEGIRYDSPTIGGFVVQAFWGEQDVWSASLRYAGEFGGIRVAAGIGYLAQDPTATQTVQLDGARNIDNDWSASLALMHVGTGLFVQGQYSESEFLNGGDAKYWLVQGGITKNWFGLGNTSLFAEYGEATDYIKSGPGLVGGALPATTNAFLAASSEVTFFGLGVVQNIDAAAMELYLGWRRFETDINGGGATPSASNDLDLVTGGARIKF